MRVLLGLITSRQGNRRLIVLHEWLLFIHIVGAIVFVGGGITLGVQVLGARRAPRQFLDAAKLAGRGIGVGAVLTLLSGIALVFVESEVWSFSMGFRSVWDRHHRDFGGGRCPLFP